MAAVKLRRVRVLGIVSIFTYGLRKGIERLNAARVVNHSLSNLDALVDVAVQEEYITPLQKQQILNFLFYRLIKHLPRFLFFNYAI